MRVFLAGLLALALAGCASGSGVPSAGFLNDTVAQAFIPLEHTSYLIMGNSGSAFVIAPGVAVTNVHLADVIGKAPVIGRSRDYDLLYFRTERSLTPPTGVPIVGMAVVAYGTDVYGKVRVARGVVRGLNMPVEARCPTCAVQSAFTFEGNAGPGFSGGPVIDAASGRVVGIIFGYDDPGGRRLMYAYPMSRVRNELAAATGRLPVDAN
ncbi:MAG: serine protease [Rhizomicrobium sp.]